ncbi:MAG: Gfo/Idh/MocA family oxidoreductase [Chloroflexi bacterium]|nr:Gfo/Idh/MocA family oxidoreductase [Chloroflexota bacterium]
MTTIKAGVIGLGYIAPVHMAALRALGDVEVLAVAGARPGSARAKADQLGVPRAHDDWRDLVADPQVQVVHNCTPNFMHHAINLAAIRAGKHIVSEKPLALDAPQATELLRAVRKAGVVHAVCFKNRMLPLAREVRSRVARGDIGPVYLIHGTYLQDWLLHDTDYNWRVDPALGGVSRTVADIGSHWLDLAQFISGLQITQVCADLATFVPTRRKPSVHVEAFAHAEPGAGADTPVTVDTEDCGLVLFRFDNGARGACVLAQVCAGRKNRFVLELNGAGGSLAWDLERPNELWLGHRDRPNDTWTARAHDADDPDPFVDLFRPVYAAVRAGHMPADPTWPTFEAGYQSNVLVDAIVQSAREQRWVSSRPVE